MKIIDIFNKIFKDEEYRPKIRYRGKTYIYNKKIGYYKCDEHTEYGIFSEYVIENILNDEVEVIEENKGIEELTAYPDFAYGMKEIEENRKKINELVRVVNKSTKESEEK